MVSNFCIKGFLIGLSIAAPVGPIGVLCIRRTLAEGRAAGFVSGLGAATADGFYGFIAAFGLTFISNILIKGNSLIHLFGGLFLFYLGFTTFRSTPAEKAANLQDKGLINNYFSTLFLTLTNPTTIISFGAIFAGIGLGNIKGDYYSSALVVLGVFLGSALWWFILSSSINMFRNKLDIKGLKWVNRVSGSIIFIFGMLAVWSLVK